MLSTAYRHGPGTPWGWLCRQHRQVSSQDKGGECSLQWKPYQGNRKLSPAGKRGKRDMAGGKSPCGKLQRLPPAQAIAEWPQPEVG